MSMPSTETAHRAAIFAARFHECGVVRDGYLALLAGGYHDSAALRAEFIDVLLEGPFADAADEQARDDNDRESARIAFTQAVHGLLCVYFGEVAT